MPWKAWHSSQQCRGGHQVSESEIQLCWSSSWCWYHHLSNQEKEDVWCRNHPNDPPEQLDVAEMTNVFATNVGGTCAATQVANQQHFHLLPRFRLKQRKSYWSTLILLTRHSCLCCENLPFLAFSLFPPSSAASQGEYLSNISPEYLSNISSQYLSNIS